MKPYSRFFLAILLSVPFLPLQLAAQAAGGLLIFNPADTSLQLDLVDHQGKVLAKAETKAGSWSKVKVPAAGVSARLNLAGETVRNADGQALVYTLAPGQWYSLFPDSEGRFAWSHLNAPAEPAGKARVMFANLGTQTMGNIRIASQADRNILVNLEVLPPRSASGFGTVFWPKSGFGLYWTQDGTEMEQTAEGKAVRTSYPEGSWWLVVFGPDGQARITRLDS